MADDLLEALVRPDNLVDYQLEKESKFIADSRRKLTRIESQIASGGVVSDGPSDAVVLSIQPPERVELSALVVTQDEAFSKVMLVFTALCEEVNFLKHTAEEKFYSQLALFAYGDGVEDGDGAHSDGMLEAMIGKALPLLQDASNFTRRVQALVLNLVRQIQALHGRAAGLVSGFRDVRLGPAIVALGDALTMLLTFDALITGNKELAAAWEKYKRVADIMRSDPAKYGADPAKAAAFDGLLTRLDADLLSGNTFVFCLQQRFEEGPVNPAYRDWLRDRSMEQLDALLSGLGAETETTEGRRVVGGYGVYALWRVLAGKTVPPDVLKKQFERLWRATELLPMVLLWGATPWFPDRFLADYVPVPGLPLAKLTPRDPNAVRAAAADALADSLPAIANVTHSRVAAWLVRAQMAFSDTPMVGPRANPLEVVRTRTLLVTQAVCLAAAAQRTLNQFIAYQLLLKRDFKRRCIDPCSRLAELLKVLEGAMRSFSAPVAEVAPVMNREIAAGIAALVAPLLLKAAANKKADDALRFIAGATELTQSLCTGTESWGPARRIALDLALSVATQKLGLSKDAEMRESTRGVWQLGLLAEYAQHMRSFCDTSALYFVRDLAPALVANAATVEGAAVGDRDGRHGARLAYLFTALSDPARMLARVVHLPPPPPASRRIVPDEVFRELEGASGAGGGGAAGGGAGGGPEGGKKEKEDGKDKGLAGAEHPLTSYERYLHSILHADVIGPLARSVEADLRVCVHAVHLAHMEPPSLKAQGRAGRPPLVHLLALPPLRIVGLLVDIRTEVTHYLERTFYELTTVALHDWKTYGEMASLAAAKYGLHLTDNHLPMGCLDAGLDVLQIMRNIHVFVARYNYNLNQQFFIERKGVKGAKHLNAVTISSINASIRQHGSGMLNTTVNFAYQFLVQKFFLFTQFLYDDYIKSYLARERRFFRKSRKELDNRYPYDHAVALNRDIKTLGVTADKQTYLDKFRGLVTEIGNALGYVRMVRSAGMHAAAEAVHFVPDLSAIPEFEASAKKVAEEAEAAAAARAEEEGAPAPAPGSAGSLSAETIEAAHTLDAVLKNLTASFAEGSDYFKVLVNVFQHVVLSGSIGQAAGQADGAAAGAAAAAKKEAESHLRNFFLIVPALTINFIEHLRAGKERMDKGVKGSDAFFSDDGFAVGVAAILAITKQDRAFDSLHWWDGVVKQHRTELATYRAELAAIAKAKSKAKTDADRAEELTFKCRRVESAAAEFELLYYAVSGARTFFKLDGDGAAEEEEVAYTIDKVLA